MIAPVWVALALAVTGHVVFELQDPSLSESSALVDRGATMATINDSGHEPLVYLLDAGTGATRRTVRYAEDAVDTEAMAPAGPHAVWVGDTGGNLEPRDTVVVFRVRLDKGPAVRAPAYRLAYPDGAHDAEALFVGRRGRLYLVTKQVFGAGVYVAPRELSRTAVNPLRRVADAPPLVTDAATLPDGGHVLLRDYGSAHVYAIGSWRSLGSFRLPEQRQGESVSVGPHGRIRIGSEGVHAPVLQVRLPQRIARKLRAAGERRSDARVAPVADHGPAAADADPVVERWLPWAAGGLMLVAALLWSARHRGQRR